MQEQDREFILAALDLLLRGPRINSPDDSEATFISVIMPVFNRAQMVPHALSSLQTQSYRNFEVIVIDDASTDETPAVLRQWSEKEPSIRLITNPVRLGVAAARNRGLAVARGGVITYLDSDNLLYRDALATIADQFDGRPYTWSIYTSQAWFSANGSVSVRCPRPSLGDLMQLRNTFDLNVFSHRRALYDALGGFDERMTRLADWELCLRYAKVIMPRRVAIPVSHYRDGKWPRVTNEESFAVNAHRAFARHSTEISRSLRVLYVVHAFPQVSETYIVAECRYMRSRGVNIMIWSKTEPAAADPDLLADASFAVIGGKLADAIASFKPDVIHVHWASFFDQHWAVITSAGLPVTVRGHSFDFSPQLLQSIQQHDAVKAIYVFPTQSALLGPGHDRVKAVPVCFDPEQYRPCAAKDRRLVLRAGVALPTKDIESFIEVATMCPQHRFVLFACKVTGNPDYLSHVVETNQRFGSPVDIHINRPAAEVAALMRQAGIYLHTYNPEKETFGMPISVAEAMATGAYVLARNSQAGALYLGSPDRLYDSTKGAAALIRATLSWDDQRWRLEADRSIERAFAHHAPFVAIQPVLDDWMALTRSSLFPPVEADSLLNVRVDDVLSFGSGGNGVAALRTGFHRPEAWGTWAGQSRAEIAFATIGPGWPSVNDLILHALPYTGSSEALSVRITVNDREQGTIEVREGIDLTLPLRSVQLNSGSVVNIAFHSAVSSPRDFGGRDLRRLGLALVRIAFRRGLQEEADWVGHSDTFPGEPRLFIRDGQGQLP